VQYEPTIEELRHKYEVAMKEKMLVRLEKERLQARTEALEALGPPPPPRLHQPLPLNPVMYTKRGFVRLILIKPGGCNNR